LLLVKIQGFRNAVRPTTYPIYVKLRLLICHRFLDKLPELDDDPDEETSDIEVEPPKLLAKISVDTKPGPKKRKHNPKDDDEGRFTT